MSRNTARCLMDNEPSVNVPGLFLFVYVKSQVCENGMDHCHLS